MKGCEVKIKLSFKRLFMLFLLFQIFLKGKFKASVKRPRFCRAIDIT